LVQCVLELGGLVGRVNVDQDRADAGGGVLDDDPLVAVGRPDPDAIPLADTTGQQATGRQSGLLPEFPVGGAVTLVADDKRLVVPDALDRAPQVLADGLTQQGDRAGAVGVGQCGHASLLAWCDGSGRSVEMGSTRPASDSWFDSLTI